ATVDLDLRASPGAGGRNDLLPAIAQQVSHRHAHAAPEAGRIGEELEEFFARGGVEHLNLWRCATPRADNQDARWEHATLERHRAKCRRPPCASTAVRFAP